MNKLIVIEGQDRVGKDYLFEQLKQFPISNALTFYQRPFPPNKPFYRTHPQEFKQWADSYITAQTEELLTIGGDIIMVRFLLSELVYSGIFRRSTIAFSLLEKIKHRFEYHNVVLLFKDYEEYLQRLKQIGHEGPVEYQEPEFNRVIKQYEMMANTPVFNKESKIFRTSFVDPIEVQTTITNWLQS